MVTEGPVFRYGGDAVAYLAGRDKRLGRAMEAIGPIRRAVIPDLFQALVNSIVGQQISTKAQQTIWGRMTARFRVEPGEMAALSKEEIQSCGITLRKAGYIKEAAERICRGEPDLEELSQLADHEVCRRLSELPGVGWWTAEMLLLFSLERPDVFSYGDLAIHRGLRMLYGHREVDRERFERYRRRYSPWGSVASLYLWEIASGRHGYVDKGR